MEWSALGWRDGILLLVALTAIYLVVMLLRLTRVGRQRARATDAMPVMTVPTFSPVLASRREGAGTDAPVSAEGRELIAGDEMPSTVSTVSAVQAYVAEAQTEAAPTATFVVPPMPTFEWDEVEELLGAAQNMEPMPPFPQDHAESPAMPAARTAGFGEHLADHLARSDMEMEVQRMRDEMKRMQAEMEEMRAARRVSPQYAEAMELSQRGLTAQDVADRLGISLAEAELVHALSRGDNTFDEGDEHGEDGYAPGDRNDGRRNG
jgi:hypothetical protein